MISQILALNDPTNPSVQVCRTGLTNDASITTMINNIKSSFVNAYIASSSSKRRKRGI